MPSYTTYMTLEASSTEAMQKAMAEPLMVQFLPKNMSNIELAMTMQEGMRMLQGLQ